jgi:hypothetical protein
LGVIDPEFSAQHESMQERSVFRRQPNIGPQLNRSPHGWPIGTREQEQQVVNSGIVSHKAQ